MKTNTILNCSGMRWIFSEVKLRECIVPRPDIVALSIDSSLDELRELFVKTDCPGY